MKTIITLCTIIAVAAILLVAWWFVTPDRYGEDISSPHLTPLAELLENPEPFLDKAITVEGTVLRQCAATGCFFFFAVGERSLRVELSDIAPTFPQRKGYRATVTGTLRRHNDSLVLYGRGVVFSRK